MSGRPASPRRRSTAPGAVFALDALRIERALEQRSRYRYVQPSVEPREDGRGWVIVSPNCSRNIDPDGGVIPIAWFEPSRGQPAAWRVHRRDHARDRWLLQAEGQTLDQALTLVCSDALGVWWP